VPHAFKLVKEHGKSGLVVILNESQATKSTDDLVGFMIQNFTKYGSWEPFITRADDPFPSGSNGIPHAALIGVDGRLLMIGNPNGWGKKLDEAMADEFKKIKDGWGKSPEAKKARAQMFGKNLLGEAAATLAAAEGKVKEEAKADFEEAKTDLDAKYAAMKTAVKTLMEAGRFADAQAAATKLQKSVKGKADWEAEVAAIVAEFAKPEVEKELKLDKALAAIVKSIGDKRPTEDHEKKFKDLAKKNDGTKVAARATEMAAACNWKDPAVGSKKDKDEKDDKSAKEDKPKDPPKSGG
jgi:hypothetical protein